MNEPNLVNDAAANTFRQRHSIPTGLKATLGDYEKHEGPVRDAIVDAHNAANEVFSKVKGLTRDETRTDVAKHYVASQVFAKGEATILKSQATIVATANALEAEAVAEMKEGFETDQRRSAIHTEIRAWIRDTAKAENGLGTIRRYMLKDPEVAAVICHSQPFLLGLADEVRTSMMEDCIKRHKPEASAKLDKAVALKGVAKKYGGFVKALGASSFNPTVAAKWHNRIEA